VLEALDKALASCGVVGDDLDGLISVPSMSHPHIMEAHYIATKGGFLPRGNFLVRTIDTGGAGPVTGILEAKRMILNENCEAVAVVAGDAVSSMSTQAFLEHANLGIGADNLPSPVIPNGYSRVTAWQMDKYGVTRDQLSKVPVLMSHQAARHPLAVTRKAHTLDEVKSSPKITNELNLLECARRMDGAGACIVASSRFLEKKGLLDKGNNKHGDVVILGGGESSGPLFPPNKIDESMFSCEAAARHAYVEAQLKPSDIDFFGLYDCFPICFLRAVEAVGLAGKGKGGDFIDEQYDRIMKDPEYVMPINTHGGLLSFGAPWEAPSIFLIYEAIRQLTGDAQKQQIRGARRALVYGNGGIFSSSAVAILSKALPPLDSSKL